ncbi:DB module, partial [Teladorsagia circumcincta]
CCERSGVANTAAGGKCLTFCDQRPNRFTTLDTSYLPCYDVFENMKRCFFVEIRAYLTLTEIFLQPFFTGNVWTEENARAHFDARAVA